MQEYVRESETIAQFCRLNTHTKNSMPIRSSEMGLLQFIAFSEHPPTSGDAVLFFKVSPPTVTVMLNALIKKGYITKGHYPGDARRFVLLTTKKGKKLIQESSQEYFKNLAALRQGGLGTTNTAF